MTEHLPGAAQNFPGKMFVVDSGNATIGEMILVERAIELMDQGLPAMEIAKILDEEKPYIRLIALLDTLEYLKRGGRISSAAPLVGEILSVKPVVAVRDGKVVVLGNSRGSKNGNSLLTQEIEKADGINFSRSYALAYPWLSAALLQKYITDSSRLWQGHTGHLPLHTVGGTIGTHVGPGPLQRHFLPIRVVALTKTGTLYNKAQAPLRTWVL